MKKAKKVDELIPPVIPTKGAKLEMSSIDDEELNIEASIASPESRVEDKTKAYNWKDANDDWR